MKKLVLAVVAVVFTAVAAFADLNLRLGGNFLGSSNIQKESGDYDYEYTERRYAYTLSGEYMFPVIDMLKVGGGVQFMYIHDFVDSGRVTKRQRIVDQVFMPVYVSAQLNPFKDANEGIFFKGNLGYAPLYNTSGTNSMQDISAKEGGFYYGIGMGYEFSFGLIFDVMVEGYSYSYNYKDDGMTKIEIKNGYYGQLGINLGYKFKI